MRCLHPYRLRYCAAIVTCAEWSAPGFSLLGCSVNCGLLYASAVTQATRNLVEQRRLWDPPNGCLGQASDAAHHLTAGDRGVRTRDFRMQIQYLAMVWAS
eukprot:5899445-Pleurochrysis_carterae.AAC.4